MAWCTQRHIMFTMLATMYPVDPISGVINHETQTNAAEKQPIIQL